MNCREEKTWSLKNMLWTARFAGSRAWSLVSSKYHETKHPLLLGGWPTILKNDGVRQWEGWHLYEMENKTCSKPPISLKKVAAFGCVSKFLPLHAITGYSPRGSLSWWICLGKKDPILGTPQYPRHSKGAIGAIPINGWFRMDKSPTKNWMIWGSPVFRKPPEGYPIWFQVTIAPISSCFRHEKFTSDPGPLFNAGARWWLGLGAGWWLGSWVKLIFLAGAVGQAWLMESWWLGFASGIKPSRGKTWLQECNWWFLSDFPGWICGAWDGRHTPHPIKPQWAIPPVKTRRKKQGNSPCRGSFHGHF